MWSWDRHFVDSQVGKDRVRRREDSRSPNSQIDHSRWSRQESVPYIGSRGIRRFGNRGKGSKQLTKALNYGGAREVGPWSKSMVISRRNPSTKHYHMLMLRRRGFAGAT
jgi:hypothetical protein